MKTKDLIKALQEEDPSGEMECVVGNHSVVGVWTDPAYWDGCMQVVERDPATQRYKARITSSGHKVVLWVMGAIDVIENYPEAEVKIEVGNAEKQADYEKMIENARRTIRKIERDVELSLFQGHVLKVLKEEGFEYEEENVKAAAEAFFCSAHISRNDPIPQDILEHRTTTYSGGKAYETIPSYASMRSEQWRRQFRVSSDDTGKAKIERRP